MLKKDRANATAWPLRPDTNIKRKRLPQLISSLLLIAASTAQSQEIELSSLNGLNGLTLIYGGIASGAAVSNAGDVNGDGVDDIMIGAPEAFLDGLQIGITYVVFGVSEGITACISLFHLDGSDGFRIVGEPGTQRLGFALAGGGDFNGDGVDDLAVGSLRNSINGVPQPGLAHVIYGQKNGFSSSINIGSLEADQGISVSGVNFFNTRSAAPISFLNDLNGDGITDLALGAGGSVDENGNVGGGHVVFGASSGVLADLDVSELNGSNGFQISPSNNLTRPGYSVSGLGDINHDNLEDLIISTVFGNVGHVIYGSSAPFPPNLNVADLNGSNGFEIKPNPDSGFDDDFVSAVSGAGDVNVDGVDDFLVGAIGTIASQSNAHVVFGRSGGFGIAHELSSTPNTEDGFRITAASFFDHLGNSVSNAGDFNGDGIDDFIVSAYRADTTTNEAGVVYIIFGSPVPPGPVLSLNDLSGRTGIAINGYLSGGRAGSAISNAGDFNNDGVDDVIIGAPGTSEGYIVFGIDNEVIFANKFEQLPDPGCQT